MTGHAIAAGALCLLAADARLGAAGDFRIGLNEVAVGLKLPIFAMELARQRLSKRRVHAKLVAHLRESMEPDLREMTGLSP